MPTRTPTTFHLIDPRRPAECFECEGTGVTDVEVTPGCPVTERVECDFCGGYGLIDEPECRECNQLAQVEMRDDEQQFSCLACLHHFVPDGCEVPAEIMALLMTEASDEQLAEMAQALR